MFISLKIIIFQGGSIFWPMIHKETYSTCDFTGRGRVRTPIPPFLVLAGSDDGSHKGLVYRKEDPVRDTKSRTCKFLKLFACFLSKVFFLYFKKILSPEYHQSVYRLVRQMWVQTVFNVTSSRKK